MSAAVPARWLAASDAGGARPITTVTCTVPGSDPIPLNVDGCVVTKNLDKGPRFEAAVTVQRVVGQGTLDLVLNPAAVFTIEAGFDYGAGQSDVLPFGVYELGQQPRASRTESIPLSLVDQWKRLEECQFTTAVTLSSGSRTDAVRTQVLDAMPGVTVDVSVDGGTIGAEATWDTDRTQLINDLSRDGSFWSGFAGDGTFEIRPLPVLGPPVATYTDGDGAKIVGLSTERTAARIYNAVVVRPTDGQGWSAVTVAIDDTTNPRDPSYIGLRPYPMTAPTASNRTAATSAAQAMLPRVTGVARRVEVTTWAEAHIEPGDTIATVQSGTWFDGAESATWLVETVQFNTLTTETTITGRSVDDLITEEI